MFQISILFLFGHVMELWYASARSFVSRSRLRFLQTSLIFPFSSVCLCAGANAFKTAFTLFNRVRKLHAHARGLIPIYFARVSGFQIKSPPVVEESPRTFHKSPIWILLSFSPTRSVCSSPSSSHLYQRIEMSKRGK